VSWAWTKKGKTGKESDEDGKKGKTHAENLNLRSKNWEAAGKTKVERVRQPRVKKKQKGGLPKKTGGDGLPWGKPRASK